MATSQGNTRDDPKSGDGRPSRQTQLDERQERCFAKVEVKSERLVNGQFNGRGARAASKRQSDRKAGQAYHENQSGSAGQYCFQHRPFKRAEHHAGWQVELGGKTKTLSRQCLPALYQQARGQRQVEEYMSQYHAVDAIN